MRVILIVIFFLTSIVKLVAQTYTSELWDINSLTSIGGHTVTVDGNPIVYNDSQLGDAVKFDGNGDKLTVDAAPVGSATEFTVEVIFKPDAGSLNITNQPRFICFWDPNDASSGPRMTIEMRSTSDNNWYFDGFLKTDAYNLTLTDATKLHPINGWEHAAIVYKNKTLYTYINGNLELSGALNYTSKVLNTNGKVSIGARYNKINWYSGLIKTVKVSQAALDPTEFILNMLPTGFSEVSYQNKNHITVSNHCNKWQLKCSNSENIQSLNIMDFSGNKVGNIENVNSQEFSIDHSKLIPGAYILRIQTQSEIYIKKVIKLF